MTPINRQITVSAPFILYLIVTILIPQSSICKNHFITLKSTFHFTLQMVFILSLVLLAMMLFALVGVIVTPIIAAVVVPYIILHYLLCFLYQMSNKVFLFQKHFMYSIVSWIIPLLALLVAVTISTIIAAYVVPPCFLLY